MHVFFFFFPTQRLQGINVDEGRSNLSFISSSVCSRAKLKKNFFKKKIS